MQAVSTTTCPIRLPSLSAFGLEIKYVQERWKAGNETHVDCHCGELDNLVFILQILTAFTFPLFRLIQIFAVLQTIVSIAVAVKNSTVTGGYKSASFAAIWSWFLVIIFTYLGGTIIHNGRASPVNVGFLIGVSGMLTQLCFVLAVVFFVLSTEATNANLGTLAYKQILH